MRSKKLVAIMAMTLIISMGFQNIVPEAKVLKDGSNKEKLENLNSAPEITASDRVIKVGDSIDLLKGVEAKDKEDGNLTNRIRIEFNDIDYMNVGKYTVVYRVEDSMGAVTRKKIHVTVRSNEKPIIELKDMCIKEGEEVDLREGVIAKDFEDGDITSKIEIYGEVDIYTPGTYRIKYKVVDSDGNEAVEMRDIEVKKRLESLNSVPKITAKDISILIGETVDLLEGVKAEDREDGDLTNKVKVEYTNVDFNKVGTYVVRYEVKDSKGATYLKEIVLTIRSNEIPKLSCRNRVIIKGENTDLLKEVSARDYEDGDLIEKVIIEGDLDVNKAGTYNVRYKVVDSDKNEVTVEKTVTVLENVDFKNHFAENEIKKAMEDEWIMKVNKFRPNDSITRAEFIKIVNRAMGYTEMAEKEEFEDVYVNDWYYDEVKKATLAGYISINNTKFRPNDYISREEVAAILTNIKNNKDRFVDLIHIYEDHEEISKWALHSVEGAIEAGYMGKNTKFLRPRANISRAEAILMVSRV